jgi:biotin carboxylase
MTILILGAGTFQKPAIHIALKRRWKVYVADGNKSLGGEIERMGAHFSHVDLKDKEGLARLALRIISDTRELDGVFTVGTDFTQSVAYVAKMCGLRGTGRSVAYNTSVKDAMRSALDEYYIPQPAWVVASFRGIPDEVNNLYYPLVAKPVDNMGARGVTKVEDPDSLEKAVQEALRYSEEKRVIIEEYMSGPELSIDAIVYSGQVTICGIADRDIQFSPHFVEMGHTMPSQLPQDKIDSAVQVFKQGIKALGIYGGAAKGDIKVTEKGAMVGEIASRLSGGFMSGWTYPMSSGRSSIEAALDIAVGIPPKLPEERKLGVAIERAIISIPGRVQYIEDSTITPYDAEVVDIRVKPEDYVKFPTNNVEKCGNVVVFSDTLENAQELVKAAMEKITIRLKPNQKETDDFLYKKTWCAEQDMFSLKDQGIRYKILRDLEHSVCCQGEVLEWGDGNIYCRVPKNFEMENCKDWNGESIQDAFRRLCYSKEIKILKVGDSIPNEKGKKSLILGSEFWLYFIKGGIQGGLYYIDSIWEQCHG